MYAYMYTNEFIVSSDLMTQTFTVHIYLQHKIEKGEMFELKIFFHRQQRAVYDDITSPVAATRL